MTGSKKRQIALARDAFLRLNELFSCWKKGVGARKVGTSCQKVLGSLLMSLDCLVVLFVYRMRSQFRDGY